MAKQATKTSGKPKKKTTSKPAAKAQGGKKQFFLIRWIKNLIEYIKASYAELKKVSWPSRKELFKGTGVVLLIILIFTVVVYFFDTIFSYLTNLIYNLA
jgi:preprotein translocase subunit SecE